jgi:serine/threonine-protein kinase
MGEVWRATDTKLNREVAIKILPEAFAADPDRLARFQREAQVLASLNHPNIAAIYGVEDRAIVMELVGGSDLAGPLAIESALPLIHQLIDALEYAHEKGVIHRDLKPANIKITQEGRLKVLDFGLAKALSAESLAGDPASSPTLTMGATMAGVLMGTAAYMAPEQARGQSVDKRADIWAFGVVVYEMLTGRKLFGGPTVSDTLAGVLKEAPDLDSVPAPARTLVQHCLEKDARRRMRDIGDARILLNAPPAPAAAPVPQTSRRPILLWSLLAALIVVDAVLGVGLWRATRPADRPLMWLSVDLGPDAIAGRDFTAAVSPDGTRLVFPVRYGDTTRLAVRSLGQPDAAPLTGTEGGTNPFFSPDGEWVAFAAAQKLKKISVHGGPATTLCDRVFLRGGSWSEDGFIIAAIGNGVGLSRIPESGGEPQPLTKLEAGEITHRWPQILPGGKAVLFSASSNQTNWEEASIEVLSLKTGQRKTVQRGAFYGRYVPSGHLVYFHGGSLYGMAYDIDRLEPKGPPATLLEDVAVSEYGGGQFDFSGGPAGHGTLVYLSGKVSQAARRKLVWIDAGGKTQPFFAAPDRFNHPTLSPDGKKLAVTLRVASASGLWVYDLEREIPTKLARAENVFMGAVWAPDGRHLVYGTSTGRSGGLMWIRADGGGDPQPLLREDRKPIIADSVSPDGRLVVFSTPGTGRNLFGVTIDTSDPDHPKGGTPEPLPDTPARLSGGAISPDGRWLAYSSTESPPAQVFVRPFANGKVVGSGMWQISVAGGAHPVWSKAARQLFYVTPQGRVMVVDYTLEGDSFQASKPRLWADQRVGTYLEDGAPFDVGSPSFALTPDGKRIITWVPDEQPKEPKVNLRVTMVVNWFDELRRRLPPSGK